MPCRQHKLSTFARIVLLESCLIIGNFFLGVVGCCFLHTWNLNKKKNTKCIKMLPDFLTSRTTLLAKVSSAGNPSISQCFLEEMQSKPLHSISHTPKGLGTPCHSARVNGVLQNCGVLLGSVGSPREPKLSNALATRCNTFQQHHFGSRRSQVSLCSGEHCGAMGQLIRRFGHSHRSLPHF